MERAQVHYTRELIYCEYGQHQGIMFETPLNRVLSHSRGICMKTRNAYGPRLEQFLIQKAGC